MIPATWTLVEREWVRFLRQPSRLAGAVGTPLLFWLVVGSGFGASFRGAGAAEGQSFLAYFLPGIALLTVIFASIFSTISVIQDRQTGFLQAVLASPAPRAALVAGKVTGGTLLGLFQGGLLLALAPLAGIRPPAAGWAGALLFLALSGAVLTSLGFWCAWRMDSIQGFHAVMNLVLMPLWLLSGAVFPAAGAHPWVRALMAVNPLSYGLAGMRRMLWWGRPEAAGLPAPALCAAVLTAAVVFLMVACTRAARRTA